MTEVQNVAESRWELIEEVKLSWEQVDSIFGLQKYTWHRELIYSSKLKSGMHEEQRQSHGRNTEGTQEAMPWIIISEYNKNESGAIRDKKNNGYWMNNWEAGLREAHRVWTIGSGAYQTHQKCVAVCEGMGFECWVWVWIFLPELFSKIRVSVMECNNWTKSSSGITSQAIPLQKHQNG